MVDEVGGDDLVEYVGIARALVFPHEVVVTSDVGLVLFSRHSLSSFSHAPHRSVVCTYCSEGCDEGATSETPLHRKP
jgi:hypothetical protein